jgi:putative ABC transport system permease protein
MLGLILGIAKLTVVWACGLGLANTVDRVVVASLLVLGGVGVGHIMLVSVTERTREIGLYKAVGAQDSTILGQFVLEAAALAGVGGVLGIGLGLGMILFVHAFGLLLVALGGASATLSVIRPLGPVAVAFGISIAIGAVAGGYPAYRAARIDTVDALTRNQFPVPPTASTRSVNGQRRSRPARVRFIR